MDVYFVLGVARTATLVEIKRAYRHLARRFHPDVNPGDAAAAARFREIAEAYEVLSDPDRRRQFDVSGEPGAPLREAPAGFTGFDFSAAVHAHQQSTFGDLFDEVLRPEAAPRAAAGRGADLHVELPLTFDESLRGGLHRVVAVRQERCARCYGTGAVRVAGGSCPLCQGTGTLRSARGHMVFTRPCRRCSGSGQVRQHGCSACSGMGLQQRSEAVTVRVPAGVADGERLRVAEKGHLGPQGAPPGDLYVDVRVAEHPLFRRQGDDLHLVVPVAVHEAALGARVEVPTAAGTARLRIPPGTQSGQRFRLRGRGAPSPRLGRPGDLVVEVRLMLPAVLDERSKVLLREFGTINGEAVRADFDRAWKPEPPAAATTTSG